MIFFGKIANSRPRRPRSNIPQTATLDTYDYFYKSLFLFQDVECEVCNKKIRKRNLPSHVKTHGGFKGIPCKFCTKEFPTIGSLKRHEKIHTEDKEHKCTYCGKGFVQKANMQAHERIHTGERPFKCQFCNEGFVQLTRRKQHEATCKMRK
jgi:uncharacterized Zn-finger protein